METFVMKLIELTTITADKINDKIFLLNIG